MPRALAATAALLVAVSVQQHATAPAEAQAAPPFRVEVSTTTGLLDGEQIEVRVIAQGTQTINGGQVKVCRADATYTTISDSYPFNGKCPGSAISSSASPNNVVSVHPLPDRRSAVGTMRIGTGRVQWGPTDDTDRFDLTCDAANPCRLVVFLRDGSGRDAIDPSTELTFTDADPLAGCGGTADGALSTGGPDRFIDSWAHLTRLHCQATGERAVTTAVLTGEGAGLTSFHSGSVDLTYSAVGPVLGERQPAHPSWVDLRAHRPQRRRGRRARRLPVDRRRLARGPAPALQRRAPHAGRAGHPLRQQCLRLRRDRRPCGAGPQPPAGPGAPPPGPWRPRSPPGTPTRRSGWPPAGSTPWPATRGAARSTSRSSRTPPGASTTSSSDADPPFEASFLELYTQRAGLKKAAADPAFSLAATFGAQFVLTDLATATQLGIPTVAAPEPAG